MCCRLKAVQVKCKLAALISDLDIIVSVSFAAIIFTHVPVEKYPVI